LGEDSAEERNAAVEKFQNDPNIRVFVGSTIAAGVGLTLTAADTVVFADLMWSPADHEQAADRVHRISQENPVFIYYMIYKDSIESMIWGVVGHKLGVLSKTLDGKEAKEIHPDVVKMVFNSMLHNFRSKKRT
jgi:SWI/SNF-related matrix-associated actin-dependent regulator 1 of chromatin subfamily A